jgi:predicted component of type VI protein secretion system
MKKLMNLETNSTRDLCRGINEFIKSYQPRISFVKDENGDLLADNP